MESFGCSGSRVWVYKGDLMNVVVKGFRLGALKIQATERIAHTLSFTKVYYMP